MTVGTIYTVGYGAGWTPAHLSNEVVRLGAVLWDIRYAPSSRKPGWSQAALRDVFGRVYVHMAPLGNRNHRGGDIVLVNPEAALAPARAVLARGSLVLLCGCADVSICHRRVAADYLSAALDVLVHHVVPPT